MGLVTAEGARVVNTARRRRPLHRHRLGRRRRRAGSTEQPTSAPHEVGFASGACLAIPPRRVARGRAGCRRVLPLPRGRRPLAAAAARRRARSGSSPRRASTTTTSSPRAPAKWRHLERNRWAMILRTYPAGPARAARPGAARHRARAGRGLDRRRLGAPEARALASTLSRCAAAPAARAARDPGARARSRPAEFARGADAGPRLAPTSAARPARGRCARLLRAYWSVVLALLGGSARSRGRLSRR